MYNEPKYDEDLVNLGYLNDKLQDTQENINEEISEKTQRMSTHYTNTPQPPYKEGDTWIKDNKIYTCIATRNIGVFNQSDWVTESGASKLAESKSKTYTSQPKNYHVGDTWILQSDTDHKAGKKGEILNAVQNSETYNESHWVKDIKYGLQSDINKIAENLDDAINKVNADLEIVEGKITTTYYQNTIPEGKEGDLWYVTEAVDIYKKGKIYRFDGENWNELDNPDIEKAIESANQAQLTADKKIQSFYSKEEPAEGIGVGDLWTDLDDNNKLYRYNGTNWMPVYDTRVDELVITTEKTSETVAEIQTDLGKVTSRVSTVENTIQEVQETQENFSTTVDEKLAQQEITNNSIKQSVSQLNTTMINDYTTKTALNTEIAALANSVNIKIEESETKTQQIGNDVKTVQESIKDMSYKFGTKGLNIGTTQDANNALLNNTGIKVYNYQNLQAIFNYKGSGVDKLIVTGSAQLGRLRFTKSTKNAENVTKIFHLDQLIENLTDLEV